MAEQMTDVQLMFQEKLNTGTAWTRNEKFEKDGYLVVKDLWDPEELYHPLPDVRGQVNYWDNNLIVLFLVEEDNRVLLDHIDL